MGFLTENLKISKRKFLALVFLFLGSLGWFFSFYNRFNDIFSFFIKSEFWLNIGNILFLFSIICSSLIGRMLTKKIDRKNILFWSTFLGVLSSILIVFLHDLLLAFVCSILIGASFGFIMPSVQAYFIQSTIPEERGRISGFIVLSIFIFSLISQVIFSFLGDSDSIGILSVTIILRLSGLLPFLFDSIESKFFEQKSWSEILKNKDFGIYLLAYVLFNVCSGLVSFIWYNIPDTADYIAVNISSTILRYAGIAIIAIVTGFLADRVGRKKPVIIGVVLLGIAYALVGLELTPQTYFFQMILSGLAWGILIVTYNVIPGDLASSGSEERFYTLGLLIPFILYTGINGAGRFLILDTPLDLFSTFLSIVLFLSVIPLLYAKETLSESKIEMAKIKGHIKRVHKVIKGVEREEDNP